MAVNLDAQLSLRTLFACHFALTALVLMGDWPGYAYLFYNGFLLALLIWAEITPPADSELLLLKCLGVEAISVLFDIIVMAARYNSIVHSGIETFALVMAVFHLLGRLPSCFVLLRLREANRTLQYGTAAGGGGASGLGGGLGAGLFGGGAATQTGPGGYEEFPPSYGAGVGPAAGAAGYGHDTKPLPP